MGNAIRRIVTGVFVAGGIGLYTLPDSPANATMVGLYTFDNSADLGFDSSGNGNDLVIVGSVAAGTGLSGGGLRLAGNGYLSTPTGMVPFGFPVGASSYTISLDFKTPLGNYAGAFIGWGNYGNYDQVNVLRTSNETGSADLWGIHNYWWANDINAEPLTVGDTGWHQALASYDAVTGLRQLSIDGTLLAADHPVVPSVGSLNFALGTGNAATQDYVGTLDNVAVYDTSVGNITPISLPEPTSMSMLGVAVVGMIGARWRKRRGG